MTQKQVIEQAIGTIAKEENKSEHEVTSFEVANHLAKHNAQLLEQRNELLEAAKKAVHMMQKGGMGFNETGLRNAIKNCEQ